MKRMLACILIGVSIMLGLAGCATTSAKTSALPVDLYMDNRGGILFHEETVPMAELPRLLARERVPRQRTIAVHVTDTRDKQPMAQLTAILAQAGYRRITFIGVRHADATVR